MKVRVELDVFSIDGKKESWSPERPTLTVRSAGQYSLVDRPVLVELEIEGRRWGVSVVELAEAVQRCSGLPIP
jgi:hypothetical protein